MERKMIEGIILSENEKVLASKLNLDTEGVLEMRTAIEAYDAERTSDEIILSVNEKALAKNLNLDTEGVLEMRLAIEAYNDEREELLCVDIIS